MRAGAAVAGAMAALMVSATAWAETPIAPGPQQPQSAAAQNAAGVTAAWNAAAGPLRVVTARCRYSTNGHYFCHLELRATAAASGGLKRCLYMEFVPPSTWLRVSGTVCDDGSGAASGFRPLPRP